ncbi:MAG: oligoendopeptidase F [Nibricoccus sp.]
MKTPLCLALSLATVVSATAKPETNKRAEIPAQYKWDYTPIFANWDAWEEGLKQMQAKMDAYAALKGTLAKGPEALLHAFKLSDEIGQLQYRVYGYTSLQRDTDTRDNAMNARLQRVQTIFARFGTATAWFTPELLTIPQSKVEKWIADTPALAPYRFPILETFRQAKHVLDEKGERLLSLASQLGQSPAATFSELSTSDIKFPKIKLTDGREVTLTPGVYQQILNTEPNQVDRAKAWEAYYQTYAANINTYASLYNGVLQRDWYQAQARNFSTTLEASLDHNAIPASVVETLVSVTRAGAGPLQRYAKLRKKLLGLETYHIYDNFAPIFQVNMKVPYEEGAKLVLDSVAPLGNDYVEKYKKFVTGGRVDVYENEGKRSGAYCDSVYGVGPYLLLNYTDTLDDVFTFAHEGGHAMHTVLSFETQPFATADYTIFVAEVASTTNERFLLNKLLEQTTDPKERFVLLQNAVDAIVSTYYTQVLFADYELQAHKLVEQGQSITAEVLNNIYLKLLRDYYGEAVTVDDLYKVTWARIPHFYQSPYYVYQYATCFASSAKLVKAMTTGDAASRKAATERYLTLLRSGGNDHPMEQLRKAGVDLSQRETIQAVIDQMDELVTRLEAEAAKIKK